MNGTLVTIAKDVKIQVEFNPATSVISVDRLRKRMLPERGFNTTD